MFNFSASSLMHRLKFSRITNEELEKRCPSILESFPIHSVHLLIPSSNAYKEKYEDILISDENTFFLVKDIPATCFIQNTFLECFVKSGFLLGVTNDVKIESDNCLAISPPGKLILSLERNIAQTLALHKEKSLKKKGKRCFQTIVIDLTCPELRPGKKLYKFIFSELSKIDHIHFNVLIKWKSDGNICTQSLKSYFISQGIECVACKSKPNYSSKFSVPVPKISYEKADSDTFIDVLEWIGTQICGLQYAVAEDEYVSKFTLPDSFESVTRLHRCSFEGFYSKAEILPVIQEMSKIFESNTSLPFVAICINGFQDAYIQANGFQFFSSDDKLICIIIFQSCKYWLITLNCR